MLAPLPEKKIFYNDIGTYFLLTQDNEYVQSYVNYENKQNLKRKKIEDLNN